MDKLIITSMRENAGKTSLIVGLAKVLNKKFGYIKPLGDRLLYRKKQLWDYDSALITSLFDLTEVPQEMSIGFDHAKLRYMYDEAGMQAKLQEVIAQISSANELLFVESGKDLTYGTSVHLDAITLARSIGARLLIVVSGDDDIIVDQIQFLTTYLDLSQVEVAGIVINQVSDLEDFRNTYLPEISGMGLDVLGLIPYTAELTHFSVDYLVERLFAKVIAGEAGLGAIVQNIYVGAVSVNTALRKPSLNKENILTITSGDRTDVILSALENDSVGVVLTNNILPPSNIISKASERNIPLLVVTGDTYEIARQIDNLQPLLTKEGRPKIDLVESLIKAHVELTSLT